MPVRLVTSPAASARIGVAEAWLAARAPGEEVLVVGATPDAANELLRRAAAARGAAFGWHRATLPRLAMALASALLPQARAVPVGALAVEALATRVLHAERRGSGLGRFEAVARSPGLVRAAAGVIGELRLARLPAERVEKESPELARWLSAFEALLEGEGVADRARLLALATECAASARAHPWLGLPTLLLDVAVESAAEQALCAALCARAPELCATLPAGDASEARLAQALGARPERLGAPAAPGSLAHLQTWLFEEGAPPEGPLGEDVALISAPGESRECVEIARRIHALAARGVAFDRIAVLLRSPEAYRPHLAEAFGRAGIPAHFARGTVQPDPTGRAFLALLRCRAESLSARGFAEYLSQGEVPDAAAGAPPAPLPRGERFVTPDVEVLPEAIAAALAPTRAGDDAEPHAGEDAPVAAGRLRAPRAWERLLVDAAVIGGRERWSRRLDGLAHELAEQQADVEDPDSPLARALRRDLEDLAALREFALPLLDALAQLPESASWRAWLEALGALASRALRRPERVLSVLGELEPMAAVGPVDLEEVLLVLSRRLLELAEPPAVARYGRVFVAPCEAARGLAFDVVFVPGLAERLFPQKIEEEPILLDAARRRLDADLAMRADRLARERLALRVAVGAATRQVVLSYPRLDLDQARPRVPSFYTLEALRAAEGQLPGWDEMAARAEECGDARVGWPAPRRREDAIDEAEHDLSLLERLADVDEARSVGAAHYLLDANPHLGRALRFRARRWLPRWTGADGLVRPGAGAREAIAEGAVAALAEHALAARSFSPTALQHYAACPYRFLLYAVHKLAPREEAEAMEELDPLTRGSLVHEVQFRLFGRLRDEGLLPVAPERYEAARALLDETLEEVAAKFHDDLAPGIPRVFEDAITGVRADLREWLRRASEDDSGYVPWRFELAFGLPGRRGRDPHSRAEPVALDCGIQLRGSIDLVERRADGRLRVTDHKTGKDRVDEGDVIRGGESLQPVLYALAVEKLFPEAQVDGGRLYYCTAAGNFATRDVALDARARAAAAAVAQTVGQALADPFLPAAPARDACRWCDYRVVCGPYEELRTARKEPERLAPLRVLREQT